MNKKHHKKVRKTWWITKELLSLHRYKQQLRMFKEINVDDKSLFEANGLTTEPQGNMTLEEAYDFVMDKVRTIYDIKDAV
ncbi:MAG: hypothetical protein IJ190_04415 [Prevotella sp.]|nr:hypothetical protein [Prevotella sp.]